MESLDVLREQVRTLEERIKTLEEQNAPVSIPAPIEGVHGE